MTIRRWICPRCGFEFEEEFGVKLDCPRCGAHLYTPGIVVVNGKPVRTKKASEEEKNNV